jgi:hypothetical protein
MEFDVSSMKLILIRINKLLIKAKGEKSVEKTNEIIDEIQSLVIVMDNMLKVVN